MAKQEFLNIVKSWTALMQVDSPEEFLESVQMSAEQEERINELTSKFVGILVEKQKSVDVEVSEVLNRIRSNEAFASSLETLNDDLAPAICEGLITGFSNVLRQQIPRNRRRQASEFLVDWSDQRGAAKWVGVPNEFLVSDVLRFTAEHVAGATPDFANVLSQQLLNDFREQAVRFPRLELIETEGTVSTYRWTTACVSQQEDIDQEVDADIQSVESARPLAEISPIFSFFRDAQLDAKRKIEHAQHSGSLISPSYEAQYAVSEAQDEEDEGDSVLCQDVSKLLDACEAYSGASRKQVVCEVSEATFWELESSVAAGDQARAKRQAKIVKQLNRLRAVEAVSPG